MANPKADNRKLFADLGKSTPLVPPIYQSSVYTLPDLDALDRIMNGEAPGYIYARDAHPNARHLADQLTALEGGSWGLVCGSGMAAVTGALLAVVQQGDRIVASNRLYGRTTQLLGQELVRFGVQSAFVDCNDLDAVREALATPAKMLLVETLSNPLLRLVDVEALADLAHEGGSLLLVDNTFATPVLTRPLKLGADFVVESLTKMIGGHSDVTLGVVCGHGDFLAQVSQVVSIWGLASNPFDCWLAERGLATLPLRMRAASANAAALADWLAGQPGVSRVIYPGRADHPDHDLAGRLMAGGCGNMLCFELSGGRDAVNRFLHRAKNIPFSPSLGNTTTTCSHPGTTSHRYVSPAEKKRQGIGDGLIRLSVGVEEVGAIQEEIGKGLK
ncbi:MAG TPA: aminotransferase class I/II-fold pyridoxal phosphate-dependent enzyme [Gemmataceae bacterium]|nr:aminotransferase class I/II-fold pyridoxal phosphate-dependent enzyme [Gemmataceae bacterium]